MQGIFIGKDGSMGFEYGKEYQFNTFIRDNMLYMRTTGGLWCPYGSLEKMLENWRILSQTSSTKKEQSCGGCKHLVTRNLGFTKQCKHESR